MDEVSLLIHGPLRQDTYKFYCRFYPDVPKIFSTWEKNKDNWNCLEILHLPKDVFLENKIPNRIGNWERRMELDAISVLSGLEKVKTEFVIKLRGDEWYSNLQHVCALMKNDKEKLFMAPVFLKKWEVWPSRISDHLLAGKTSNLKLMYDTCLINIVLGEKLDQSCWPLPYQSILAMGYINKKYDDLNHKDNLKKLFGVVHLDELKYYKVSSESGDNCWYSNFTPFVKNIEEI